MFQFCLHLFLLFPINLTTRKVDHSLREVFPLAIVQTKDNIPLFTIKSQYFHVLSVVATENSPNYLLNKETRTLVSVALSRQLEKDGTLFLVDTIHLSGYVSKGGYTPVTKNI